MTHVLQKWVSAKQGIEWHVETSVSPLIWLVKGAEIKDLLTVPGWKCWAIGNCIELFVYRASVFKFTARWSWPSIGIKHDQGFEGIQNGGKGQESTVQLKDSTLILTAAIKLSLYTPSPFLCYIRQFTKQLWVSNPSIPKPMLLWQMDIEQLAQGQSQWTEDTNWPQNLYSFLWGYTSWQPDKADTHQTHINMESSNNFASLSSFSAS